MSLIPTQIFCPKCGVPVPLNKMNDPMELLNLDKMGYVAGARGSCKCGVILAMFVRPMPRSPTFTVMFDIYEVKGG